MKPINNEVSEFIERTDITPQEALQFYADQKNFDIVDGHVRIIDNGAVASNALKHLCVERLELKGDAELTELRAFKAACEGQKPVAVVTDVYGLVWYGSGPIAPIVRRNNIKVGAPLYANQDPEAAHLRMRIAEHVEQYKRQAQELQDAWARNEQLLLHISDLKRQLANERASGIHSCGPNCQRPGCVERRERDQRVAEACAKVVAEKAAELEPKELRNKFGVKMGTCWLRAATRILRSGEWKKHMKGGE